MRKYFWVVIFSILFTKVQAQEPLPYVFFEPLYVEGGTRYDPILSIAQDKEGFLWFGSTDGLHLYNGYNFRSFRKNISNPNSLIDNNIESLFVARNGTLWIGTTFHGVMFYRHDTEKFTHLPFPTTVSVKTGILEIKETLEDSLIWMMGQNKTLYYHTSGADTITLMNLGESSTHSLISLQKEGIVVGSKGHFLVIKNKKIVKKVPLTFEGRHYSNTDLLAMAIDPENRLWIGTHSQGLFVYDLDTHTFIKHYPKNETLFFEQEILRLNFDQQGYLWIKDNDKGIIRFDPKTEQAYRFKNEPGQPGTLTQNNVRSFFQDDSGIIWIGTNAGINKLDRFKRKFKHYFHNPLDPNSLTDNMIRGFLQTSDKKLWIATYDGNVNVMDLKTEKITSIPFQPKDGPKGKIIYPFSFEERSNGNLFIGTSEGLFEYHTASKHFEKIPIKNWESTRFGDNIRQIIRLGSSKYLFFSNGVVYSFNSQDYSIKRHEDWMKITPPFETINRASFLYKDPYENFVWVGMYGRLAKLDLDTDTLTILPLFEATNADFMVMCLHRTDQHLWIGTFNSGLLKVNLPFNGDLSNITYITPEQGLPHNTIYGILPDMEGNLWLSTNKGISKFNPVAGTFLNYSNDHGVQELEFNRLAFAKLHTGEIVFGGVNGFNRFLPEEIRHNPHPHFPKIVNVRILNEFSETDQVRNLSYQLIGKDYLELSHKQNFITFQFASTQFSSPKLNSYYYQLKGYNKDWVYAGTNHEATFTGLKPGTYQLLVRSVNPDGVESSKTAMLTLKINGPVWMKWWFISLVLATLVLGITLVVYERIRRTKKQNEFLENQVKNRTKELKDSKEQLARLNEKKDLIFSILAHDIRSPLTTLKGYLDILYSNYGEIPAEEVKKHLESIKGSIATSIDLLDNTLFWSLSQMDSIKCTPSKIDLERMVRKVKGLYDLSLSRKKLTLETHFDRTPLAIWADENMVNIILRNLLSNAIKFTPEKNTIEIRVHANEKNAHISVIDTGIGMSPEAMATLFNNEGDSIQRGTSNERGTGLGLVLCKNFTEMNQGTIEVASTPNQGTTFIVTLPLA
jgi:signal transduction histidine kinase/ligand-binding sensor domain-containing protein